ncbi:MAG: hypothetical protein JXR95_06625 [Deltaproteobacteria bacterium]|nr:hypothetical protein [Deltaproteobacteria bacterium]
MLPVREKMLLSMEPEDREWINAMSFAVVMAATDIHITTQIEDFSYEFGRYFIEENKIVFMQEYSPSENKRKDIWGENTASRILQIALKLEKLLPLLSLWMDPIVLTVDEKIFGNEIRINMTSHPIKLPIFCDFILGVIVGLLELIGVADAEISEEKCMLTGSTHCVFLISWSDVKLDFI